MNETLSLYAIRSKDGKWYKNVGFGDSRRSGKSWVDSLDKARIYAKIGQARGRISWWTANFPGFGAPDLIELKITEIKVLDDSAAITKNKRKKLQAALKNAENTLEYYQKHNYGEIKETKKDIEDLKEGLSKMQ